jgi:predicted RNase H-like nuclease (RuvC/YqgF family)
VGHDFEVQRICVIAYLEQIRNLDLEVRELEWRISDLRERLESLSGVTSNGMRRNRGNDSIGNGIARLEELEHEWSSKAAEYSTEILKAYDLCPPSNHARRAIFLHVVSRMTWSKIGSVLGYSERTVRRLGNAGITDLYPEIPEEFKQGSIPNSDADFRG